MVDWYLHKHVRMSKPVPSLILLNSDTITSNVLMNYIVLTHQSLTVEPFISHLSHVSSPKGNGYESVVVVPVCYFNLLLLSIHGDRELRFSAEVIDGYNAPNLLHIIFYHTESGTKTELIGQAMRQNIPKI